MHKQTDISAECFSFVKPVTRIRAPAPERSAHHCAVGTPTVRTQPHTAPTVGRHGKGMGGPNPTPVSPQGYQEAYTVVQSVLQIKTTISVPDLAIKFGCARIQISTQRNLKEVSFIGWSLYLPPPPSSAWLVPDAPLCQPHFSDGQNALWSVVQCHDTAGP